MKLLIVLALFAYASCTEFSVKSGNNTCLLLTVDGTLDLAASKDGKTLDSKSLKFESAKVLNTSDCSVIKLDMGSTAQVWFQQNGTSPDFSVIPVSTFSIQDIFDKTKVNETGNPVFIADALGPFTASESYACLSSFTHQFKEQGNKTEYTYTTTASTTQFQVQFGDIKNETFSPGPHCSADKTTTPTPTTSTPTPATTTVPPLEDGDYNVTNTYGNITCIRMYGGFSLTIPYETKEANTSITVNVPVHTTKASGSCNEGMNTSDIVLSFMPGNNAEEWMLKYTFATSDDPKKIENYYVSQIEFTYSNLPNATSPAAKTDMYRPETQGDYLKSSVDGYYLCNSEQTVGMKDGVELKSQDFKYYAFNKETSSDFSGDVAECSADDETSSIVPIAVGAALAGLVVIVLVAYLIGRRRSRKTGYESV